MATIWLDSAATGAEDGTSYADAVTTISAANTLAVATDTINMVATHIDTAYLYKAGVRVVSVDSSGVFTPSTIYNFSTATSADTSIVGPSEVHGIGISTGDDLFISAGGLFQQCLLQCDSNASGFLSVGNVDSNDIGIRIVDSVIDLKGGYFTSSKQYNPLKIRGGSFISDNISSAIVLSSSMRSIGWEFSGVDLSGLLATNLIGGAIGCVGDVSLLRCIIPAGVVLCAASISGAFELNLVSVDVGDGYHYFYNKNMYGELSEDTSIYRTDGATYNATNGFSIEAISNSASTGVYPYKISLASQYIDTADYTTDVTFTIHFAVDGSTTSLNSDEFWIEIEHVDGADNALGVLVDTKALPLATGTAPTTETALWTGLSGTNKQMSISKTITIGTTAGTIASGLVRVNAYLGKASQTVFVCPQVEVS